MASWVQRKVKLKAQKRGCHLITDELLLAVPEVASFQVGLMHAFLQHTSASLTINESFDEDVRGDMEKALDRMVPEDAEYAPSFEEPDQMPAHVKSSVMGCSITVPITAGKLALGRWQGVYLCEHRNSASGRTVVITIQGQTASPHRRTGGGAGVGAGAGAAAAPGHL